MLKSCTDEETPYKDVPCSLLILTPKGIPCNLWKGRTHSKICSKSQTMGPLLKTKCIKHGHAVIHMVLYG